MKNLLLKSQMIKTPCSYLTNTFPHWELELLHIYASICGCKAGSAVHAHYNMRSHNYLSLRVCTGILHPQPHHHLPPFPLPPPPHHHFVPPSNMIPPGSFHRPRHPFLPGGGRGPSKPSDTLIVRKIPKELNSVTKLSSHFEKFGTVMHLTVRLMSCVIVLLSILSHVAMCDSGGSATTATCNLVSL